MGFFDRLSELTQGSKPEGPSLDEELERARALFAGGEGREARQLLENLAAREARDTRALLVLGDELRARGEEEDAAVAYGRAADRAPTDATAWGRLGETLAGRRRFEPARDALRRCLALEPGGEIGFRARRALGRLYLAHGQPQRALRELSLAIEEGARVDPQGAEEPGLLADRGRAALALGDPGGADWLVRAARAGGAHDVSLLLEAARAKADPRDAEALLREAAAATTLAPSRRASDEGAMGDEGARDVAPAMGSSEAPSGAPTDESAVAAAEPRAATALASRPSPSQVEARAALVRHLAQHGQATEAFTLAHELVASAPDEAATYGALAVAASGVAQFAVALAAAEEAAKRGLPRPLHDWLAWAFGLGMPAAVERALVHATPDDPLAATVRRWQQGLARPDEARELAALGPHEAARRFVLGARAMPPLVGTHAVALLNRAEELAAASPVLAGLAATAAHAREAFDRPLGVAVMGEFNAGKSTFVNALVGADIAPVGVTPTTATLNVFRHGPAGGRAIYLDGRVEELPGDEVASFLAGIADPSSAPARNEEASDEDLAATLARTEIFAPVEVLRALEIVDTPGLNALRPAHERLARSFLEEADALVWLFAVDQAAKASEREVLASAHAARKKIVGVLSKVDRAEPAELEAVEAHVRRAFGPWLEALVPVSAKQARKAQKARAATNGEAGGELEASGLPRVREELERAFLGRARALKAATALGALDRFAAEAQRRLDEAEAALVDPARFAADVRALAGFVEAWRGALATERVTLRARLDEIWRNGALELATLIEPRAWALGENRARAGDEAFLDETLEEGLARALAASTSALQAVGRDAEASVVRELRARAATLVEGHVSRFEAYARGVRESGLAAFFRYELAKLKPQAASFRHALARTVPEVEAELFAPLERDFLRATRDAEARLADDTRAAELERLAFVVTIREPFAAFRDALGAELAKLGQGDDAAALAPAAGFDASSAR